MAKAVPNYVLHEQISKLLEGQDMADEKRNELMVTVARMDERLKSQCRKIKANTDDIKHLNNSGKDWKMIQAALVAIGTALGIAFGPAK